MIVVIIKSTILDSSIKFVAIPKSKTSLPSRILPVIVRYIPKAGPTFNKLDRSRHSPRDGNKPIFVSLNTTFVFFVATICREFKIIAKPASETVPLIIEIKVV